MTNLPKLTSSPVRAALAAVLAVAVPATAVLVPAAPAAAQSAERLDQAIAALRAITTMKADFTQTDRNGQAMRGVLTLKRPGKIRFEYAKGVNMLLVADGKSLYFADYDARQLERWPIGNTPLGALLNPSGDIKRYARLVPTSNPDVISVQAKDPRKPEQGEMTLIFVRKAGAPGGWELSNWVMVDAQNTRTTVRLSNHRYGMTIADSAFTYRDPRRTTRRPG
jgi:outer membrane lipoprotein-sorting protein